MAKTGASVRKQLKNALGKVAKADSDDDQADRIADELNLTALSALDGSEWMLSDVAQDRAQDELLSLGISEESDFFSHANTRAADYAKQRAGEDIAKDIEESTRRRVRDIITYGLNEGLMREDIIDMIEDQSFGEARATLIADTEIAMASGQGALAGYKEAKAAGVKLKKVWVCTDDPCDECQQNEDIGPIPVDSEFPSGDDAEVCHPFCRCHTESVVEDEDEGDDE